MSPVGHLFIVILVLSLLHEDVPVLASLLIMLVLQGQFLQGNNDVLSNRVLLSAILAAKIIQEWNLVQEVVDDSNEDSDTKRV